MGKQSAFLALTESDIFIFSIEWPAWYCPPPMEDEDAAEKTPAKVVARVERFGLSGTESFESLQIRIRSKSSQNS